MSPPNQTIGDHPQLGRLLVEDSYPTLWSSQSVGIYEIGFSIVEKKKTDIFIFSDVISFSYSRESRFANGTAVGLFYKYQISLNSEDSRELIFRVPTVIKKELRRMFGLSFLPNIPHSYHVNPECDVLLDSLSAALQKAEETSDLRLTEDFAQAVQVESQQNHWRRDTIRFPSSIV